MSQVPASTAAQPQPALPLPISGQALRNALAARDVSALMDCARSLRVAGYRVDAGLMADQLLRNGCASIEDAFGRPVAVHVRVARPLPATEAVTADFHYAI